MIEKTKAKEELNAELEIDQVHMTREIVVCECSAKTGLGVWEGIDKLIEMFEERKP